MNNLNNKVFIATGSQDKFASAVNRLLPFKIKLIQKKLDIIEPQEEDIKKGQELGSAGYLVKANLTPAQVVEKIKEVLK